MRKTRTTPHPNHPDPAAAGIRASRADAARPSITPIGSTLYEYASPGERCMDTGCTAYALRAVTKSVHTRYSGSLTIRFLLCRDHESAFADAYDGR